MKVRIISILILLFLYFPATATLQEKVIPKMKRDNQHYRLARQYEVAGKYQESLQIYQRLWNKNPQNITYYRGVKNNLINLKRFTEAIETTEKMLTIKKSYYLEADLGEIYHKLGETEKALQIWDEIIKRNKTQPLAYQAVANSMISNRLIDKAIEIYKMGRDNNPNKSIFLIELANLYNSRLDYKNATLMYLEYLKYSPNQFTFVEGQLARLAKNIEEVEPIIEIISDEIKKQNSLLLRRLLAGLYIQTSNYEQALEAYKFIDENITYKSSKEEKDWGRELFNFAQNAFNDEAYEFSQQAFTILISRYPDSPLVPRSQLGVAEAAYRLGDYIKAIQFYEKIIAIYPRHIEAQKSYLRVGEIKLFHYSEPQSAKESFITVLNKFSFSHDHFEAMFKLGECEIHLNKLDKAKEWYQKTITSRKVTDMIREKAQFRLALIDFWQGNFNAASDKLKQITQIQPIFIKRRDKSGFYVNDALKLSILINENMQESEILKEYANCLFLIEQLSFNDALTKLMSLVENNPQSQLADDIWLKIGELECRLGYYEKAIGAYRSLINNYPESMSCDIAQKQIGEIYETRLGKSDLAMKEYESILANYPESILLEEVRKKIRELDKSVLR